MNLQDVIDVTNNIIDETDLDEQVEVIVKNAINFAYLTIANKIDKKSNTVPLIYSKIIKLPKDCTSVIDVFSDDYVLSNLDYSIKSDSLIFHTKEHQSLTLLYNKNVTPLTTGTDVLDIDDRYCFACAMYGAYVYSVYRKRVELANLLLSDYNNLINNNSTTELEVNAFDVNRYSKYSK